ncbi:MAG: hypothetical protein OXF94_10465, partial [Gammaproteobacteria bacterium]|nr:hypothetical protein [Gammaproteobacteria bacterium]
MPIVLIWIRVERFQNGRSINLPLASGAMLARDNLCDIRSVRFASLCAVKVYVPGEVLVGAKFYRRFGAARHRLNPPPLRAG